MQLVLDSDGVMLRKHEGSFLVSRGEESRLISPDRVSSIAVTHHVLVSAAAIRLAARQQIPIYFFSRTGKIEAKTDTPYFQNLPDFRRQQVLFALDPVATEWVVALFDLKKQHQNDNLKWLAHEKSAFAPNIEKILLDTEGGLQKMRELQNMPLDAARNSLMGIEGSLARAYWQTVGATIGDKNIFDGRSRRPATDPFNAALNYTYGMLYTVVEQAVWAVGLDPQLGFLHVDDYAKPTLVFDLIEPFRPWADRILLEAWLKKEFSDTYFEAAPNAADTGGGVWLSAQGKRWLIPKFNEWLEKVRLFDGKKIATRQHIYRFTHGFSQQLKRFKFKKTDEK